MTTYIIDTEGFRGGRVGTVYSVKTIVVVVVEGPITVIPKEQRGGTVKQRIQGTYFRGLDGGGRIFAAAVVDGSDRVVIDGQRVSAAAHLCITSPHCDDEKAEKHKCRMYIEFHPKRQNFHTAKIQYISTENRKKCIFAA